MTDFTFEAKTRKEKAKAIRMAGFIPGIIYGKDFENTSLSLEKVSFEKLFREAGSSNLIDMKIDGKKSVKALVHDVQYHPVTDDIQHVDFVKIDMKQKIRTEIPINYTGKSPLIDEEDGSFISHKDTVEVECLPSDLISEIEVDASQIKEFSQNLTVSDITVPKTIEILDDPEEVIALVQPPRSEEELEALEEEVVEDVDSIEVEKVKDEEEEGEEGEEKEEGEAKEEPAEKPEK